MKTRNVFNTVAHTLPDWHVGNDLQFGRITAYDPQARYEIIVNLPDRDTIRIIRTQYELVEDNTVLNTADMGEEQALAELSRLLSVPMPRTDRLMWLKDQFDKTAEWCRNTIGGGTDSHRSDIRTSTIERNKLLGYDHPWPSNHLGRHCHRPVRQSYSPCDGHNGAQQWRPLQG